MNVQSSASDAIVIEIGNALEQRSRELEASGAANALFNKWYGPGTRPNIAKRGFTIHTDQI